MNFSCRNKRAFLSCNFSQLLVIIRPSKNSWAQICTQRMFWPLRVQFLYDALDTLLSNCQIDDERRWKTSWAKTKKSKQYQSPRLFIQNFVTVVLNPEFWRLPSTPANYHCSFFRQLKIAILSQAVVRSFDLKMLYNFFVLFCCFINSK